MTNTGPNSDDTLAGAADAARARIDEAIPGARNPGDDVPPQEEPAGSDEPFDIFADNALENLDFGNVAYRDGKKLEKEIRSARDTFRPFHDAFSTMSDDARQALLDAAPTLGEDLAALGAYGSRLHPDDRAWFVNVMNVMSSDPVRGAELLAAGADAIRGAAGVDPIAPTAPAPGAQPYVPDAWAEPGAAPAEAPMTRAELEAFLAERDQARDFEREVRDNEQQILAQARELGYDPESNDPVDDARFAALIHVAGRPDVGGDLEKAHGIINTEWEQRIIDKFVNAKSADAERPGALAGAGATPAQPRTVETLQDGREAMLARLDAVLGPAPQRR
jgi:hypothetical protein